MADDLTPPESRPGDRLLLGSSALFRQNPPERNSATLTPGTVRMGNTASSLARDRARTDQQRFPGHEADDHDEIKRPAKRRRVQRCFSQESTIVVDDGDDWNFAGSTEARAHKKRTLAASQNEAADQDEEQIDGVADRHEGDAAQSLHDPDKEPSLYGSTLHLAAAGGVQRLECHKELLLSKSRQPASIEQNVADSVLGLDLLPMADVDHDVLRIFLVWLYTGRLVAQPPSRTRPLQEDPALQARLYSGEADDDGTHVAEQDLIGLAIIAERYDMPDLLNATMTEALARSKHVEQTFTAAAVNKAYRHLDRDSVMIKFLVRHAAENIDGASMPASAAPFWSEHLGDVIRWLLEHRRGSALHKTSPCTYHDDTNGRRSDRSCLRSLNDQPPAPDTDLIDCFDDMTTVLVGPQRQRIRAYKAFLCRSSPIFQDAISGQLAESSSEELCLDTETVSTFSTFLTWMYTGHIDGARVPQEIQEPSEGVPGSRSISKDQHLSPVDLISLYIFGDNWEIPTLRNDVVSFLIDNIESTDEPAWDLLTTRHEHIHLAFDNLPKGSPLLRFLIAEAAWLWKPSLLEQDLDDLPNDFLAGVLNARPRVERRRREGMLGWTPWRDDICVYHDHGPDEAEKQTCHEKHRDLQQRLKAKIRYGTAR